MISLNGGRSLRSLAYAPFGARRSRAVRSASQPGPPPPVPLQTYSFPSTAGASSARLPTRRSARGAVAPSSLLRSPAHLPLSPSKLIHFPQRRARAPLACLRAMRRGTRSRAPDLRPGTPHYRRFVTCRAAQPRGQFLTSSCPDLPGLVPGIRASMFPAGLQQGFVKVVPIGVLRGDKTNLPGARPVLHGPLSLDG